MEKKEKICKTAIDIIAKNGYHNLRVQMIADEANVAVGTIYHYFKSKEEVLEYIFMNEYQKRIDFLNKLEDSNKTPLEKFKDFWEYHLDLFKEDRNLAIAMVHEIVATPENTSIIESLICIRGKLRALLDEAKLCGQIREGNIQSMVNISSLAMRGIVYSDQFKASDAEFEILKKEAIEFIINGIKK